MISLPTCVSVHGNGEREGSDGLSSKGHNTSYNPGEKRGGWAGVRESDKVLIRQGRCLLKVRARKTQYDYSPRRRMAVDHPVSRQDFIASSIVSFSWPSTEAT